METTCQVVTRNLLRFPRSRDDYSGKSSITLGSHWPGICRKWNAPQFAFQRESLNDFPGMLKQSRTEARERYPGCLLADDRDLCPVLAQVCGDGDQQRAASCDHNALVCYR